MTSKTLELPSPVAARLPRAPREFLRYFGASFVAMGVDVGLMKGSLMLGLHYTVAATIGFMAGLVVAYVLSVRWAFERRRLQSPGTEFGVFAAVGVAGLLLTEFILWVLVDHAGTRVEVAKLVALPGVFLFNFGARKALLFRGGR